MWTRRAFLRAAGSGFAASLLPRAALALEASELVFASSVQRADGAYAAALVSESGAVIASVALPDRGHDVTYSRAARRAVAFARQPGTFAVVFDPAGKEPPLTIPSVEGRHFFGHGVFSPDGRLLYATENDFDAARGMIGVYAVDRGYNRIGEFSTYGVGPHEVLLMPDGRTLVIANGGIETHPDYGRAELNLDTMQPSVAFVDAPTGDLIGLLKLEAGLHQLSIRHMAFDRRGRVWFGCQFRGEASRTPQLVGYATRDGEIRLIELPDTDLGGLRNYVGSVAASAEGDVIAVSSPEGDTLLAIDVATASPVARLDLTDGSGLAPDGSGFLASTGDGQLIGFAGTPVPSTPTTGLKFDNHLRLLRTA